jgi:hypothetical protein
MDLTENTSRNNQRQESDFLYDWRFTAIQFVLETSPLRPTTKIFIFKLNTCDYNPYATSSLARGWVCRLQLLLALAIAVILRSESRGTHDQMLLSQIRDSHTLEGQVPVFISARNRVVLSYPRHRFPFSSSVVSSCSYRKDSVGNTVYQLLHYCVLLICCLATDVHATTFYMGI